ncbi:MAG: DMT family transporter [Spirochaetales bacterium]|nr:DMT family transporter [Spirochaetales bacterium]
MRPPGIAVQLAMATTMLFWGVSFVASKLVLEQISPVTYMAIRFLIASAVLAVVMLVRGRPRFSRRTHALIALTALAEPIAYFLFESFGPLLIPATTAALIIATIPLAVAVLASLFLGEPLSGRGFVAVFVSMAGIVLLVFGASVAGAQGVAADIPTSRLAAGVLLVVGAVLSAACYITLARNLNQRHDPVSLTIVQTWWGGGAFALLWVVAGDGFDPVFLDGVGWAALLFLSLGATVAAFLLYNWALRYERASRAALYINAIPVVTAVTGRIVLDERLTALQWVGALFVLVAVRLSSSTSRSGAEALQTPIEG